MDTNKWQKLVIKEFISSDRRAALYFILSEFEQALQKLKSLESSNVKFLFPVKSFNHPQVLSIVARYTSGFDVSNENELNDIKAYLKSEHVVWSSSPLNNRIPGVLFNDINSSTALGMSDYSSYAIRITPDFVMENNRFGIASALAGKVIHENDSLRAVHCHLSGIMNKKVDFMKMLDEMVKLINPTSKKLSLNFGGGLSLLSFEDLKEITEKASLLFPEHQLYFEPGRWLSKQCGLAVGKVMANERNIITTTLSAACHLRWLDVDAEMGITSPGGSGAPVLYHLYGPTCFENDKIGTITMPEGSIEPGQFLIINHVSGYSHGWNHAFNGVDKADVVFLGASA